MRLTHLCLCCLLVGAAGLCGAQDLSFPVGPSYLQTSGSPLFARPLATPSLSLGAPLPDIAPLPEIGSVIVDQPFAASPELEHQADLFPIFYGYPMPSVVELASPETLVHLPESIVDVGVIGMTDVQSLRERGYGATLGETASFWKSHKSHAPRVYTNADVERLHGS